MSKSEVKRLMYLTYNNFGKAYKQMELIKATIIELIANGATKVEIVILEHESMINLKKENEELKTALSEIKGYKWCPSCHNEVSRLIATEALKEEINSADYAESNEAWIESKNK